MTETREESKKSVEGTREQFFDLPLRRDLTKTVIDKLLIGLLIILAGFWANLLIEKFKAEQTLNQSLSENRIKVLSEAWRLSNSINIEAESLRTAITDVERYRIGELESALEWAKDKQERDKILRDIQQAVDESAGDKISELKAQINSAYQYIRENRFWLSGEEYGALEQYLKDVRLYSALIVTLSWSEKGHKEFAEKLSESRKNLESIREGLFEE